MSDKPQPAGQLAARFVLPRVVYEIEPGFAMAARLDGHARQVRRLAVRQLEPHSIEPFAHRSNVSNAEDLRAALQSLSQTVGNGGGSTGLLVPDGAVRVAFLDFETLPENRKESESLVLWKMKENLPAEPEEVRLSCQVLQSGPAGVQVLAIAMKTAVLAEYEQALEPINGGMALILPATMALLPLVPDGDGGGELLLHVCAGWITAVVLSGNRPRSWRCSEVRAESPETFGRAVAFETARVMESARDHLGVQIQRVRLLERPRATENLGTEIAGQIAREVTPLSPPGAAWRGLSEAERGVYENFGLVLAGLVQNGA
ncbi:MAG TPA: hypothetical protein VFM21_07135 [Terriglobia bacterium]|nr:hypothetical protein [Terriglobia bacterium]